MVSTPAARSALISRAVSKDRRVFFPRRTLMTWDGIEIKMRDQTDAVKNLAQFRGMLINRGEIAGPGGGPIPLAAATVNLGELTDEQLAIIAARGGNNGGTSELPVPIVLEANQLTAGSNP